MTALLPFTLTPLEGEGLVAWLGAYAARLDVTPGELTEALGLPDRAGDPETGRGGYELAERHVERIRAATGLGEAVVRALLRPGSPAVEDRRGPDTSERGPPSAWSSAFATPPPLAATTVFATPRRSAVSAGMSGRPTPRSSVPGAFLTSSGRHGRSASPTMRPSSR